MYFLKKRICQEIIISLEKFCCLCDRRISVIIVVVYFYKYLERELDKLDILCHSQASGTILLLCGIADLVCLILYCQDWRSYACRKLCG